MVHAPHTPTSINLNVAGISTALALFALALGFFLYPQQTTDVIRTGFDGEDSRLVEYLRPFAIGYALHERPYPCFQSLCALVGA